MATRTYAPEINAIFDQMEVPLLALDTAEKGKHVVAKKSLPAGFELFEEIPVASWPMDFIALDDATLTCWWCQRICRGEHSSFQQCAMCQRASFCSGECKAAAQLPHQLLCGLERELYEFHRAEIARYAAERKLAGDDSVAASLPISVDSLARCVAAMGSKLVQIITREGLTADTLSAPGVVQQVFAAATKMFNRFVEPPKGSSFDDVDSKRWAVVVRDTLSPRLLKALQRAAKAPQPSDDPLHVLQQIVDGLLSVETLNTIIGQLSLNSQALNTTAILPSGPSVVAHGGAMYALQSNFNHSCEPNALVNNSPDGSHEILLSLCKDVNEGEEITISYIPTIGVALEERRRLLAPYFFVCACPRCRREEAELPENDAEADQAGNQSSQS